MKANITLLAIASILLIASILGCALSEQQTKAEQDQIVVECAEFGLWRVMASDTESEFYKLLKQSNLADVITIEDLDFRLLLALEVDGIVLGAEQDPSGEHIDYIAFKADFYRELFNWGNLPPPEIMNTVGSTE